MSHLRTVHIEPPSVSQGRVIRQCRSVEDLSPLFKAEKTFEVQGRLTANRTINLSELGNKAEEQERRKEHATVRENSERTKQGFEDKTKSCLFASVVKIKMSSAQGYTASANVVKDLRDAQDANSKLNEMLRRENRESEAKETTIENLRHEISVLDQELADRRKENKQDSEEMRKLRSKATALQTENKILERQVNMMNESNKKLHNELHELKNKLRIQETEGGELRMQRLDAVQKYARLLQTSIDKGTRLRFVLRQLQNDIATHEVTAKKFEIEVQALEDFIQEQGQGDSQFTKYDLLSPRKMRKTALSEEEKLSLRRDLEGVLGNKNRKFSEKNFLIEKLATTTERNVTEFLKARIGGENEDSARIHKLVQEAKHQIKSLIGLESSHVDATKRMDDRVRAQLAVVEQQHEGLSEEFRLAQSLKLKEEEKLKSIRKLSIADSKVEGLCLDRRTSQVEKLEFESVISKMERKTEETSSPLTEEEKEILSLQQKLAGTTEEKLSLYDELIESQTAFRHLETLLESRRLENEKMEKELSEKEKTISQAEESLGEAHNEMTLLKQKLEMARNELEKKLKELEKLEGKKLKDRTRRVELNFTPSTLNVRQSNLVQTVENVSEQICSAGNTSTTEFTNKPIFAGIDKEVQTGAELFGKSGKSRRESLGRRRTNSADQIDGHFKLERRISKAELKLVYRVEKGVQTGDFARDLDKTKDYFNYSEDLRNSAVDENRDLRAVFDKKQREIEILMAGKGNEMESLENSLKDVVQERDSALAGKVECFMQSTEKMLV